MAAEDSATDASEPAAMEIRAADLDAVRALRHAVLRKGQPAESAVYETDTESSVQHLGATIDAVLVGVVSHHTENRVAGLAPYPVPGQRVRGLAVEGACGESPAAGDGDDAEAIQVEATRTDAVSAALLDAILTYAIEAEVGEIWANVRHWQQPAYAAAGFLVVSNEFDIPGSGPHAVMARLATAKGRRAPPATT